MKKREIPVKNYSILLCVLLGTILLCAYISSWYKMSEEAKIPKGIMIGSLPEVKIDELDNYLQENSNIILYISSSTDENIKRFEKKVHDYIIEENLTRSFAYIDAKDLTEEEIKEKLEDRMGTNKKGLEVQPNFYALKEGKIVDCLYHASKPINSKDAINFIKKQEITE